MGIFVSNILVFVIAFVTLGICVTIICILDLNGLLLIVSSVAATFLTVLFPCLYIDYIINHTQMISNEHHSDVVIERELCSVNFDKGLNGNGKWGTVLGIGGGSFVISSYDVYRYYYYTDDNKIKQDNVDVSMSYIEYIGEDETPKIVGYHDYDVATYKLDLNDEVKEETDNSDWYYVLYVPNDSVVEVFNFN